MVWVTCSHPKTGFFAGKKNRYKGMVPKWHNISGGRGVRGASEAKEIESSKKEVDWYQLDANLAKKRTPQFEMQRFSDWKGAFFETTTYYLCYFFVGVQSTYGSPQVNQWRYRIYRINKETGMKPANVPSLKLPVRPWKLLVGRWFISF